MPGPCPRHCPPDSGGGGALLVIGAVVAAVGGVVAVVEWLTAHATVIEAVLYSTIGVVVLGCVALVVAALRRDGHRIVLHYDPDAARQVAAERRALAAPVRVDVTVNVAPAPAIAAPQYHTHNHLHLHGSARELLAALTGRRARVIPGEVETAQPAQIEAPRARILPGRVESRPLVPVERREVE